LQRWKLKYDAPLSISAFNFDLRPYTTEGAAAAATVLVEVMVAGAFTRPLLSST
jgi:hypothetical protein